MIQHRCGLGCLCAALLVAAAPLAHAHSQHMEGVILSAEPGGTALVARAMDCEQGAAGTEVAARNLVLTEECVVILDGRLVAPKVAVLPGRWFYAYGKGGELNCIAVLSEAVFTPEGMVTTVAADGKGAVVQVAAGAAGQLDVPLTFETAQRLSVGLRIRVEPGRAQTVRAFSEVTGAGRREAYEGVVRSSDGAACCVLRLRKGATWADRDLAGPSLPSPVVDARFKSLPADAFIAGRYGVHVIEPSAWITVAPETGRVDGVIAAARPNELAVATSDGAVTVPVSPSAVVTRDGEPVALGDLQPGQPVMVLPARQQRVVTVAPLAVRAFVTVGPYVQNTSATGATVMWFTENAVPGAVRYGVKPGEWLGTVAGPVTNAHAIAVTGLQPATKYFYEALDGVRPLAGGSAYYFQTHPKTGSRAPIRFLAVGDLNWGPAGRPWVDLVTRARERFGFGLLLGDLTDSGSHNKYLTDFFPTYGGLMRNLCLWACPGDNDFGATPDSGGGGYATSFQFPTNDLPKVAGVFSFDYANAHFISLGDGCKNGVTKDDAIAWVRRDLAEARQRGQQWIIAVSHRPVHGGKDSYAFCPELAELLETGGVDVLLSGHSHFYKRTYLVHAGKAVQQNAASEYTKTNDGTGTVYIITGTGGCAYDRVPKDEPLTAFYLGGVNGMTVIEIEGDTLTGQFVTIDGSRRDPFQIRKSKP